MSRRTSGWAEAVSQPVWRLGPALAVIAGCLLIATGSQAGSNLVWTTKAAMSTPRYALAAVAVGSTVYAIGGYNVGFALATVEAYDSVTDAWTTRLSMPTARFGLAAVKLGGTIYAMGGQGGTSYLTTVEAYDPATNTWATKAPMLTGRKYLAAAAVGGTLYAIGGTDGSCLGTVEAYDPATNTWTAKASLLTVRELPAAAAVWGRIYAIGGDSCAYWLSSVEAYDPATDTWTAMASMHTYRNSLATAVLDGNIFAIGGYVSGAPLATVEAYDPLRNTWTTVAPILTARYGLAAAMAGTSLCAIGGANPADLRTVEVGAIQSFPDPAWLANGDLTIAPNRIDLSIPGVKAAIRAKGDPRSLVLVRIYDEAGDFVGDLSIVLDERGDGAIPYSAESANGHPLKPGAYWALGSGGGVQAKRAFLVVNGGGR